MKGRTLGTVGRYWVAVLVIGGIYLAVVGGFAWAFDAEFSTVLLYVVFWHVVTDEAVKARKRATGA